MCACVCVRACACRSEREEGHIFDLLLVVARVHTYIIRVLTYIIGMSFLYRHGGRIGRARASCVGDQEIGSLGVGYWSSQNKDLKIYTCRFLARCSALLR